MRACWLRGYLYATRLPWRYTSENGIAARNSARVRVVESVQSAALATSVSRICLTAESDLVCFAAALVPPSMNAKDGYA